MHCSPCLRMSAIKHVEITHTKTHLHEDYMNGFSIVIKNKISVDNILCNSYEIFNNDNFANDLYIHNYKYNDS